MEDTKHTAYDSVSVHYILENGTRSEILHLLKHKINLNCTNKDGDTVVHSVLKNEKLIERHILEILTILLDQKVNPNISNYRGEMALHLAIARRMKDTVNFLLKLEANVNTTNKYGNSIAHYFIEDERRKMINRYPIMNTLENCEIMEKGSISFLEFLMSKDVDFDRKNKQGNSALHLAILYQLLHILPTLLARTNDIKFIDEDNTTLLHLFLEAKSQLTNKHPHRSYISECTAKCVKTLLDRDLPIFAREDYGCTLISNAIKTGEQMNVIEPLINYYLNKCDGKNFATTLFYELLNTCTLWDESDIDYLLTVLCDLILKGINFKHELLVSKKFLLPKKVAENSTFMDILKKSDISYRICTAYSIRSSYDESLLHRLADQRYYQGSRDELYNHICNLIFCDNCEVNTTDERGKSVLQTAIGSGNFQIIPILIEFGANVNNRDDDMRTPLHDAVIMNEAPNIVGLLLSKGADVNAVDREGDTPLHLAACNNKVPMIKLLLQYGASVDSRNEHQRTPLHVTRWESSEAEETMDLLLSNGADVNAKDQKGETPLHLAVSHPNVSIVRKLIEVGATVNCENEDRQTPLHHALAMHALVAVVDLLLSNGADVNVADFKSETPLHLAVGRGSVPIVRKLLQLGAFVDCKNQSGKTPLHRAVIKGDALIVYLLLLKGVDVNVEDHKGETPLHLAVSHHNAAVVEILLEYDASVNCRNQYGQTPLHRVGWQLEGAVEIIELLLKSGADVDAKDYMGKTSLHEAIANNNLATVGLLVERGARVNDKDDRRLTPLHHALTMGTRPEIVELLVENKADVNAKDRDGNRPLHEVFHRWSLDDNECIMKMLLRKGAYVNARNNVGESALYQALSLKDRILIDELLKYGADLNELSVRRFMLSSHCELHRHILRQHLAKLEAADLPFHGEYEVHSNVAEYREYHDKCLREVVKLQDTFIGNDVSLYDFLHKRPTIRETGTSSDALKQIIESPMLEHIFPEYSVIILASYHEAVTRIKLLKAAQKSLHALIQVQLPNIELKILDYLTDEDLINTIEANVHDGADDE